MIKIIIVVTIFLTLALSANQKLEQDCKNGKMLSCVERCDISEHDTYCFKYQKLKDEGYDYEK